MNPIACVGDEVTEYIEFDNGDYSASQDGGDGSGWGKSTENQKNHATFNTGYKFWR